MGAETWVLHLAPSGTGWRTIDDLVGPECLGLAGEDDPFDPSVWADGGTQMRLAEPTVFDDQGSTFTVEFRWPDDEPAPSEWGWSTPSWLTVVARPQRSRRAA